MLGITGFRIRAMMKAARASVSTTATATTAMGHQRKASAVDGGELREDGEGRGLPEVDNDGGCEGGELDDNRGLLRGANGG